MNTKNVAEKKKVGRKLKGETGMPVSVRVSPDHLERLEQFARAKGIPKTAAIQIAIAELLDRHDREKTSARTD
jgi:predicted transcriptional regulator